ncbi:MAG: DUF983 domain-containing protein [Pseudomonadota bacterium]
MPIHEIRARDSASDQPKRDLWRSITKGFRSRCPACGSGKLFAGFLKPVHHCETCGEAMHHQRADDLPPYLVIFVVGHVVVAGYMMAEPLVDWSSWQHLALWIPVSLAMGLALLQPFKGAVIGLQWANQMHGFGDSEDASEAFDDGHGIGTDMGR